VLLNLDYRSQGQITWRCTKDLATILNRTKIRYAYN